MKRYILIGAALVLAVIVAVLVLQGLHCSAIQGTNLGTQVCPWP